MATIAPFALLGILACFFPYIYIFIPDAESDLCICSYYNAMYDLSNPSHYLLMNDNSYPIMKTINTFMLFGVNWIFLVGLLIMLFKIRHIEDETMIKRECVIIVGVWVFVQVF